MLTIPKSDITKIGIFIGLIGAFILAKNYFPLSIERVSLEGRMQFGGNSFIMKDKIIAKYNAWVGFGIVAIATIIQLIAINLDKYATWADLKGRSVFFANPLNIVATCALLFLILRIAIFMTDFAARREYYPFLKDREKGNFEGMLNLVDI